MPKKTKNRPTREEFMARCQLMYDDIAMKIKKGALIPGSCLQAEGDLTKKFQISRESVRKVIGQMISHGLVTRVKGKGIVVGQLPESEKAKAAVGIVVASRQALDTAKSGDIDPYTLMNRHAIIISALENKFTNAGLDVRFHMKDTLAGQSPEDAVRKLKEEVGGLAIVYDYSQETMDFARAAASKGIGIVFVPMYVPCPPLTSGVTWDNYQVGRMAANHLLDLGHKSLACLGLNQKLDWMLPRMAGFEDCCKERNAKVSVIRADLKGDIADPDIDVCRLAGQAHALEIVEKLKATAVFSINDSAGYGVYETLTAKGLRIPQDLSIVGCDNDHSIPWHGLTTFNLECIRTAEAAAAALIAYLKHDNNLIWPVELKIQPRLIIRESTAQPK